MPTKTKLIIVDDVLMVRLGLSQMLRKVDTIEIIAEAEMDRHSLISCQFTNPMSF